MLRRFVQIGVRGGELCDRWVVDADLDAQVLLCAEGMIAREVELPRKVIAALRNWTNVRRAAEVITSSLSRTAQRSQRAVRKLVEKYRRFGVYLWAAMAFVQEADASYVGVRRSAFPDSLARQWIGVQAVPAAMITTALNGSVPSLTHDCAIMPMFVQW